MNGDGVDDLAVGAQEADCVGTGNNCGEVHIMFMNTDGSVDSTVEINDSTTNGPAIIATDNFGKSVANVGDLDGDGVNDLAVGAHKDDDGDAGTSEHGAIHIMFMNTDGSVKSTEEVKGSTTNGPTTSWKDQFGISVANIGDLNNDGVNDIAVGASTDDKGGSNRGALHLIFMK